LLGYLLWLYVARDLKLMYVRITSCDRKMGECGPLFVKSE